MAAPYSSCCLLLPCRARRRLFDIYGNSTSILIIQKAIRRFLARRAARRQRMLVFQARLRQYAPPTWAFSSFISASRAGATTPWNLHVRLHNAALYGPLYTRVTAVSCVPDFLSRFLPAASAPHVAAVNAASKTIAPRKSAASYKSSGGWFVSRIRKLRGSTAAFTAATSMKSAAALMLQVCICMCM